MNTIELVPNIIKTDVLLTNVPTIIDIEFKHKSNSSYPKFS